MSGWPIDSRNNCCLFWRKVLPHFRAVQPAFALSRRQTPQVLQLLPHGILPIVRKTLEGLIAKWWHAENPRPLRAGVVQLRP